MTLSLSMSGWSNRSLSCIVLYYVKLQSDFISYRMPNFSGPFIEKFMLLLMLTCICIGRYVSEHFLVSLQY